MKKRIIYIILILFTQLVLTACGGGFFQDDVVTIEAIETKELQNGNIEITITYLDDLLEPVIFEIPKGKEGTGIKEVTTTFNEENNSNILTIFYTDNENTTTIEVLNGVGIKEIKSFTNEETNEEYLVIDYTNNTSSNPFLLPKGEKGDTGNGIASITTEPQEDGSTILTITYTDEEMEELKLTIPAPEKGDTGRGIESIVSSVEDDKYILTITYSNPLDGEEPQVIELLKPKDPNTWYSGTSKPSDDLGKDGDYYFDTAHIIIYKKESGLWFNIVEFSISKITYQISFDLNDDDEEGVHAEMPTGYNMSYTVERNSYFSTANPPLPIPTRSGYKFLGWCTSKTVMPTSGFFTDITPVASDLVLYAQWEKIA